MGSFLVLYMVPESYFRFGQPKGMGWGKASCLQIDCDGRRKRTRAGCGTCHYHRALIGFTPHTALSAATARDSVINGAGTLRSAHAIELVIRRWRWRQWRRG